METTVKKDKKLSNIMIVDDHPVVRYGISRLINSEADLNVSAEAEGESQALEHLEKDLPDLVIMDISLGSTDGLTLTKTISTRYPTLPILILSMHEESIYARKALRAGARGYIMKEESSDKLIEAIRRVLNGEIYLSADTQQNLLLTYANAEQNRTKSVVDKLSDRERQVFLLIGEGLTTGEIAAKLGLSVKTVDTHRARIKMKLGIPTMPQLVLMAAEWIGRPKT